MSEKYIVVFKKGTSQDVIDKQIENVQNNGGIITKRFSSSILGFAAELPDRVYAQLQSNLQSNGIDYIESDGVVRTQ